MQKCIYTHTYIFIKFINKILRKFSPKTPSDTFLGSLVFVVVVIIFVDSLLISGV